MKNTLLFTYSTNTLVSWLTVKVKNFLTLKMCDPILVTSCKMQPYYGQSSLENVTPSNGISPLASYKEVPPSPTNKICKLFLSLCKVIQESHGLWFCPFGFWVPVTGFRNLACGISVVSGGRFLKLYSGFKAQDS